MNRKYWVLDAIFFAIIISLILAFPDFGLVIICLLFGVSTYASYRKEKRAEKQEAINLANWERQARGEKPIEVERGAISTLYQGFKEKTCAKVNFDYVRNDEEDNDED